MMRYAAMQAIRSDPAYLGGEYKSEPPSIHTANIVTFVMGSSPLVLQSLAPTRSAAKAYVDQVLAQRDIGTDANDFLYYIDSSRNFDASERLDRITVPVTWVNAADDFINPPELRIAEHYASQLKHGRFIMLPITSETRGHGTKMLASIWRPLLAELMRRSEPRRSVVATSTSPYNEASLDFHGGDASQTSKEAAYRCCTEGPLAVEGVSYDSRIRENPRRRVRLKEDPTTQISQQRRG